MEREKMSEAGIDYDEGVERFGGNSQSYEKYLRKFFLGDYLTQIRTQVENKDYKGAFRSTHDLKGITGNLSLSQCYRAVCVLTERLRPLDTAIDCTGELLDLCQWYEKAKQAVGEE